jgi:hypothetical protein
MGSIKILIAVCVSVFGTALTYKLIEQDNVEKLLFKDSFTKVAHSIIEMEHLMRRFPNTYMVNFFVDEMGYLYLNNLRISPLQHAEANPRVRRDTVFSKFDQKEIDKFFQLLSTLRRNEITAVYLNGPNDKFFFGFKSDDARSSNGLRFIMVMNSSADTTSNYFSERFEILDSKDSLVLFAPKLFR